MTILTYEFRVFAAPIPGLEKGLEDRGVRALRLGLPSIKLNSSLIAMEAERFGIPSECRRLIELVGRRYQELAKQPGIPGR
jgi:hypothetical protein